MIFRTIVAAVAAVLFAGGDPPPRAFTLSAEIEAPRSELFRLWTTTEGARVVFPGADARVEGKIGGAFTIAFAPEIDPKGDSLGSNGCTIKDLVENERLVFEWRGKPDMPVMNTKPFPTAVTLEFSDAGQGRTKLTLTHSGFGDGAEWDRAREYFHGAWQWVLDGLVSRFATMPKFPAEMRERAPTTLFVVELAPGPKWVAGQPPQAQPRIMNHAAYVLDRIQSGQVLMGGRIGADHGLAIARVADQARAERLFAADPAVLAGTFTFTVRPWSAILPKALETAGDAAH